MGVTIKVEYWYLKCLLVRLRFNIPNLTCFLVLFGSAL